MFHGTALGTWVRYIFNPFFCFQLLSKLLAFQVQSNYIRLEVKRTKKKKKKIQEWMSSTNGNLLGVCRKQYKNKNHMFLAVLFVDDSLSTSHFQRHNRQLVNFIYFFYYLFFRVILLTYTQKKMSRN
jgi:hypothetical protein